MKSIAELIAETQLKANAEPLTNEQLQEKQAKWMNDSVGNMNLRDGVECDKCKNKGVLFFVVNGELKSRECSCMKKRRTLRRAFESGLYDVLSEYTFPKYIATEEWQKDIKDKAMLFCKDEDAKWFYIGGQSGIGKSHLCTAIAGYYIKQGKDVRYMLWRDDVVKLKQLANDYSGYQELMQPFKDVDVLYIDDMFKSQSGAEPTRADINIAFEILDARLRTKDKITIISSEFTINEAMAFDEAVVGRVYQKCGIYKIDIAKDKNKNYRLKGG